MLFLGLAELNGEAESLYRVMIFDAERCCFSRVGRGWGKSGPSGGGNKCA
jgi:hypothetical protein